MSAANDADRLDLVRTKAEDWAAKLIDLSPQNTLLHFKNTKTASLELTDAAPGALEELFQGKAVRLSKLFEEPEAYKDACGRARSLRRRITAFTEEQGIDVGRLAHGFVQATPQPGRSAGSTAIRPTRAPLLLRSLRIDSRTVTENDFVLQLGDEVEVNPVLLYVLDRQYGLDLDSAEISNTAADLLAQNSDPQEQLDLVFRLLGEIAERQQRKVGLESTLVVGLFNYLKQPMVEDLHNAAELLAQHDLVAALAGHQPAAAAVNASAAGFSPPAPDDIAPVDEFLVQDADSSQQRAITAALSGRHVLIEGPPGTGKSQTIANIIAGAAARGQRVLFVAEKRAAIEAVHDRLAMAGLDKLVFDLHQQKLDKKHIARQLQDSLESASQQTRPDASELHRRLIDRRRILGEHSHESHKPRDPWSISAYQVQADLLALRHPATPHNFRGRVLEALDATTVNGLEEKLRTFVDIGGLRILRKESPWWQADINGAEDIRRVLVELDELTSTTLDRGQEGMTRVLRQTGLNEPRTLLGWQEILDLLDGVNRSVEAFGPYIFGTNLDLWWYATASSAERAKSPQKLSWLRRRRLVKEARTASTDGITKKHALHAKLSAVVHQRDRWRELGDPQGEPAEVVGLQEILDSFRKLRTQLTSIALCARLPDIEQQPTEQISQQLHDLQQDKATLWHMERINQLRSEFDRLGVLNLVMDMARQDLDRNRAWDLFRHTWLKSLLDEFKLRSPALREFNSERQNRLVEEYQQHDVDHHAVSAQRVRWAVANALRQVRDDFPEETRLLRDQANKKSRHLPLRRLVQKAPHVLLALRPCWAMSPLVVSRTLPAEKLFDLVIFDEASQIEPHDAIATIARGRNLVVAGDDKQLPPTNFFGRMLDGSDDEEETAELDDYESILTAMRSLIPLQERLRWHYRSADERLIAFSNREIYDDDLVTFPGSVKETPVVLDTVNGVASPGQDGSAPAEVNRVVELMLEHAARRPHESLGVITMGQKHADRIDAVFRAALQERPDLQDFFADDAGPGRHYFIKNLERVQGDERDAIILTIGVAKRANGTVARTGFGPLNSEGGRRRLNVAVTRAKRRMTVVSSFGPHELAPGDPQTGTELLRRYLEFAHAQAEIDNVGRQERSIPLNGFENDVERALVERGIDVHPQWGFARYRIDFALAHRERPGQMVLAVEADGDTYHNIGSVRDRDRLRQAHLERLGWRFHRVWASSWYADREGETDKLVKAWEQAMLDADREPASTPIEPQHVAEETPAQVRRGPKPAVPAGLRTQDYSDEQLIGLCRWLMTDGLPLDREERIAQALHELGKRRGRVIVARVSRAVEIAQSQVDQEDH